MTNTTLNIAQQSLLTPAGLDVNQLATALNHALGREIDYADLYLQSVCQESWMLEEGQVKDGSYHTEQGVGIRAISGEKTGFAYSDDLYLPALKQAAEAARSIAIAGHEGKIKIHSSALPHQLYPALNPLETLPAAEKVRLLQQVDQLARQKDPRVKQVMASLSGQHEIILIVNHEGHLVADVRPLVRFNITVIVEQQGRRETATTGGGGRVGYDYFSEDRLAGYVNEAVRQATLNLEAVSAPAGTFPVVLGPGWPGVLLHEAVGHGLEGDFNRKGTSAFSGRIGERVASPLCTVVDNGTLPGRRGSLQTDDEGMPTQCTTLIEKGILKGYLQDRLNAKLMNTVSTGNGRRESYSSLPMPRMTNTYMLAGPHQQEEMIASIDRGLFAVNFSGGQVDITSGQFVFTTSEAYLIEKGKITTPVKGATLMGLGPDVLTKVSMVGNDLALDSGVGTCGKDGQSVPVGVGQPSLKVDALTVGGTQV